MSPGRYELSNAPPPAMSTRDRKLRHNDCELIYGLKEVTIIRMIYLPLISCSLSFTSPRISTTISQHWSLLTSFALKTIQRAFEKLFSSIWSTIRRSDAKSRSILLETNKQRETESEAYLNRNKSTCSLLTSMPSTSAFNDFHSP
jgi:hypothetical protein